VWCVVWCKTHLLFFSPRISFLFGLGRPYIHTATITNEGAVTLSGRTIPDYPNRSAQYNKFEAPKDQKEKKPGSRFFSFFFFPFFSFFFDDDQQRSIFSFFGWFFEPHIFRFPGRREEFEKNTTTSTTPTRGEGGAVYGGLILFSHEDCQFTRRYFGNRGYFLFTPLSDMLKFGGQFRQTFFVPFSFFLFAGFRLGVTGWTKAFSFCVVVFGEGVRSAPQKPHTKICTIFRATTTTTRKKQSTFSFPVTIDSPHSFFCCVFYIYIHHHTVYQPPPKINCFGLTRRIFVFAWIDDGWDIPGVDSRKEKAPYFPAAVIIFLQQKTLFLCACVSSSHNNNNKNIAPRP